MIDATDIATHALTKPMISARASAPARPSPTSCRRTSPSAAIPCRHCSTRKNNLPTARLQDSTLIEIPWGKHENGPAALFQKTRRHYPCSSTAETILGLLTQVPEARRAFVSLSPANGAILALTGGFDFFRNKYNRATQSKRQPGSGFKPIIYTTALEQGYTAASLINDAPIVIDNAGQGTSGDPKITTRNSMAQPASGRL